MDVASIEEILGIGAINSLNCIIVVLHRSLIVTHVVVGESPIVQIEGQVLLAATAFLSTVSFQVYGFGVAVYRLLKIIVLILTQAEVVMGLCLIRLSVCSFGECFY